MIRARPLLHPFAPTGDGRIVRGMTRPLRSPTVPGTGVGGSATGPSAVFPVYSRSEQRADRCVHAAGLVAGVAASGLLIVAALPQGDGLRLAALALYAGGLLAMLGGSALYNLAAPSARKDVYRRLDHAAIFVMIAGTYTPFALVAIGGTTGLGLFAFVWMAALGGVAMKLLFPRQLERLSIALYLLLGWSILAVLDALLSATPPPAIGLLVLGGLLYSLGVIFHLWERLPYHNAIWHGFVLAAAGSHYAAILGYVALAEKLGQA